MLRDAALTHALSLRLVVASIYFAYLSLRGGRVVCPLTILSMAMSCVLLWMILAWCDHVRAAAYSL